MRYAALWLWAFALMGSVFAQTAPQVKSATVPVTLDHDRTIIDVRLPLPDGSMKRVRAWVDNGNPDLYVTENVAKMMGLTPMGEIEEAPGHKVGTTAAPKAMVIGGMTIAFTGVKEARIVTKGESIAPGTSAEINLPSRLLRNYDVLVNYPDREFTIGEPGSLHFLGVQTKALINAENALIQIPSRIEGKEHNLALDIGAPIGFMDSDLVDKLLEAHPQWPHMTGAVGIANMWGMEDEPRWKLLRLPRLQYGPLFLTDVVVAAFPKNWMDYFEKRAGIKTAGLIGAAALLNYRVGLDYKHETVYFDLGTFFKAPDMDVVGLILRPEADGRYSVLGVADYEGKPSVPEVQPGDILIAVNGIRATGGTMGQVWSSLEGNPGQERILSLERGGKQFEVKAVVRHFLAAETAEPSRKKK
jgi:hypothetical protein